MLATAPSLPAEERLLKISEAARRLDCSPEWVRQLGRRGELDIRKLGPKSYRVTARSLNAYIDRLARG